MTIQFYRRAFVLLLVLSIGLSGVVVWLGSHRPLRSAADTFAAASLVSSSAAAQPVVVTPSPDQPLPSLQIAPERLQRIGVTFGVVRSTTVHQAIRTVGEIAVDERRVSEVQSRFSGWIQQVSADETFQRVEAGQLLFTIYSPDVVATEQEYLVARQHQATLGQSEVSGVAAGAASLLAAADARLRQWQVPDSEIDRLHTSGEVSRTLSVASPVSGYILERHALPNQRVDPGTRLYTIADLSTVWVNAAIVQSDLSHLQVGATVSMTSDARPGQTLTGRVDFVYPDFDATTRTARARIICPNPDLALKPGMYVDVVLDVPLGTHVVIPASAVFQSGSRSTVFVDHGGGSLEPRTVNVGPQVDDDLVVQTGLEAGERIVTSAGFLLDSESQLQAAIGAFVPPPPGAGAAASMSTPTRAVTPQIEFTTQPSPPRAGSNVFHVRVTDAAGAPLTGLQVTVQRFMPAMPAMGMAAMSGSTSLVDRGGGAYEGAGMLESAGTWRLTIIVVSHGTTIATKQVRITTPGMQP